MSLVITDGMDGNQPISFGNTSATWNMHTYFLFYHLGSRLDQKDCCNWGRKDRLTALKSQTMTFKLSDAGEKAVHCHKSEVLAAFTVGFFVMQLQTLQIYKVDSFHGRLFCYFKLQRIVTGHYLVIFAIRCWKFRGGRPCNENLAVVDEWPLFSGAVIEEFHCVYIYMYVYVCMNMYV